ncbi:SUMF1/EgtB/PvdO family nonheme iron enzyme [Azohydromonas lata]|uniref:SUMF1/EgtB/PvdO family nonheme iron enzyme n=1 Tax=Azohydromonas lata TaxID=45677 RepID=A0ABU5I8A6_9BURK|nr:SUMF1/EgtB/PvdO family nonheme iron enzyme [Azohydromonas lata]MDZ5455323.1 SUMF1/EgtB/PvdO family nonheme iron enzyme [Azohydromonas lata]
MGLNNKLPWAALVDRMVGVAARLDDLSPLLGQYGGDNAPAVPLLLEWLKHMENFHASQHDKHESRLKENLQQRALDPEDRDGMGCKRDDRVWDLLQSLWVGPGTALDPRRALELHLARAYIGVELAGPTRPPLQLAALLVNPHESNEANKGKVVALHVTRLSAADWPACPTFSSLHGCLVRAPGAYLLDLAPEFEQAIKRVEELLARTLAPLPAGQHAQVLAWSLRPLPWPGEEQDFSLLSVGGPSLGAWLALACLHLMADLLAPQVSHWREPLRELDLMSLSGTAALGEPPSPAADPLEWPLDFVGGATAKLTGLKQFIHLNSTHHFNTQAVLLRKDQLVVGNQHLPLLEGHTLADWVRMTHAKSGHALDSRLRKLHDALMELPLADHSGRYPRESLHPELLNEDFASELPAPAQGNAQAATLRAALKASLLQRYAHWAGGHYQPFGGCGNDGRPVLLSNHFHPIEIQPVASMAVDARGRPGLPKKEQVNGLADLRAIQGVDRWLCTAPPAGGKTTLLAAFEMEAAHAALQQLNLDGHFGTVALWLPLRWCATAQVYDAPAAMNALWDLARISYPSWAEPLRQAVNKGNWSVFAELGIQLVLLLDGVNEMPAQSQTHRAQLIGWMDDLLVQLATASGGCIAQRVYTVRTHGRHGMLPTVHEAMLQPWDRKRRREYMLLRLGEDHPHLTALDEAIARDPEPDDRKLMATPGHLATQITLLQSGLVSRPAQHRAELFCTLLWVRLHQEVNRHHIARELLSQAEQTKLDNLQVNLQQDGGWRWTAELEDRSLIATLARLAVSQQHLDPVARERRRTGAADAWAMTATLKAFKRPLRLPRVDLDVPGDTIRSTESLLKAAEQLNVLRRNPDGETLTWTHQLYLELFAALALSPEEEGDNQGVWLDIQPVEPPPMEQLWDEDQKERARLKQLDGTKIVPKFRIPPVPESGDVEETLRYLAQLRGPRQVVDLVARVTTQHSALAARLALDNWEAFGELRDQPQDGWQPEGHELPDGRVDTSPELGRRRTHPTLNQLRKALLARMTNRDVHIACRNESGFLLGDLGGDGRFEICGKALILKDEYWQLVGTRGERASVLMGDIDIKALNAKRGLYLVLDNRAEYDINSFTAERGLLTVDNLSTFEMAGLLVTNAQVECFFLSNEIHDARWWPDQARVWAGTWLERGSLPRPWNGRHENNGCQPASVNFWWAQAYSLWESHQRRQALGGIAGQADGRVAPKGLSVDLPTEAQWEAAVRYSRQPDMQPRWRFGYTQGIWSEGEQRFIDVAPWHFNHNLNRQRISTANRPVPLGKLSPVGIYMDSAVGCLQDTAGNLAEWTLSARTDWLERDAVNARAKGDCERVLRGGDYMSRSWHCAAGVRCSRSPDEESGTTGFRLVRVVDV